jgi:hypothetical protein
MRGDREHGEEQLDAGMNRGGGRQGSGPLYRVGAARGSRSRRQLGRRPLKAPASGVSVEGN